MPEEEPTAGAVLLAAELVVGATAVVAAAAVQAVDRPAPECGAAGATAMAAAGAALAAEWREDSRVRAACPVATVSAAAAKVAEVRAG